MSPQYQVDHNVPTPPIRRSSRRYPFSEMRPGDSFQVDDLRAFRSASRAAHMYARRHKQKYSERVSDLRIWRVK
jgi:hypothetical protein